MFKKSLIVIERHNLRKKINDSDHSDLHYPGFKTFVSLKFHVDTDKNTLLKEMYIKINMFQKMT